MKTWPLRVRLVVVVVILVAAALAASGLTAVSLMRTYLLSQVDRQLVEVVTSPNLADQLTLLDTRAGTGIERPGGPAPTGVAGDPPQPGARPPLPSEFYIAVSNAEGELLASAGSSFTDIQPDLPTLDSATVGAIAGEPFTVPSQGGGPQWRVLVVPNPFGSTVAARELGDVNDTLSRLTVLMVVIGGCILVLAAVAAYVLVRRNLAPLAEVEAAAVAIAGGDMSRRVPSAPAGTEVGEMSAALNAMLGQLEAAIGARERAVHEAQTSEEQMRAFVADASHELRTPLTAVGGYAELFRHGAIPAEGVPAAFDRIEGEAARMTDLVDDLLLLARLDQRRPLERARVDVLAVVTDRVAALAAASPQTHVDIRVAPSPAPPEVFGDAARLGQVVTNLLTNAARHGGGRVTVAIAVEDPEWVTVQVIDYGPGVADADKRRIFARFVRGAADRSRGSGGSGLGLSIVAAIITAHAGTVTVSDTPGGGATFTVRLPAASTG